MDRSQQGVVPRTCLSKYPVKPRPANGGPPPAPYRNYGPPGSPGMRGPPPQGAPRPRPRAGSNASYQQRSMSPGPYGPNGRPAPPADSRRRSNSMGQIQTQWHSPVNGRRLTPPSPLSTSQSAAPSTGATELPAATESADAAGQAAVSRKPVPGQAL
jgi:hypothetical protein